jgi:hypothetical protein
VSGLLVGERDEVRRAFSGLKDEFMVIGEAEEDGWITFTFGDQKSYRIQTSH